MCMIAEREPYTLPHFGNRHGMFMEPNNPFRSSARLMADYMCKGKIFFENPNFVVSEGRLVSRGSGGLVDEEKSSDYGNSTCIFTGAAHIKNGWVAQSKKLRVVKIINFGLDSAAKDEEASTSLLETSDNGSSGSVSHSLSKNVMFNGPLFRSHRRNAEINRNSSFIQHERENIQFNESLEGKQHELGKQKLLELPGSRLNNTIETGSSNGKSIFLSDDVSDTYACPIKNGDEATSTAELPESLSRIYDEVLVVENIPAAKEIVKILTTKHKSRIYACDTEVCKIDVKKDTPVDHGEVTCFSIYPGEGVDFGNGKSCIWVDVLDGGGRNIMVEFAPFFKDPSIKKVWHNYSFDSHVIDNYGLKNSGFHADTMHLAKLWDSSRGLEDGVMNENSKMCGSRKKKVEIIPGINQGKISIKTISGKGKLKKDGSEGKVIVTTPVEELQRKERMLWICYSSLDSISTLKLFESLKKKVTGNGVDFRWYWRPYGELLVKMETEGMLVNREALADMEKLAIVHQQVARDKFRQWASKMCHGALYMNVGSDSQLRRLFFGGLRNSKDERKTLEEEKEYKVLNFDKVIGEGKKVVTKFRKIRLHKIGNEIETEMFTASGWPSVSGEALKVLAGKETCHAIPALCEVRSIDSMISNFILPLQSSSISGKDGRIHCSLNINTETGRLSARRPNLQNQPALEKDIYKIRQAFVAGDNNSLIIADYGQLELRILAHLSNCKSMLDALKNGGDFHEQPLIFIHISVQLWSKRKFYLSGILSPVKANSSATIKGCFCI
ncbi:hypothetical protein MKX01_025647 [Papaver californicum]|nr:hypothetical protein MKX01_025647 [Papaver californicum]